MKKKINYLFITLIILFVSTFLYPKISYCTAASSSVVETDTFNASRSSLENDLDQLTTEIEKLKDENYKRAIAAAENAAGHADRLILWITGIATIYGLLLAFFSLIVGVDFTRKLKELEGHVKAAKKKAELIVGLSGRAQKKGNELNKLITEIKKTKGETSRQREKIDNLLNKAQGTINEIESLKTSASFISEASGVSGNIVSFPATAGNNGSIVNIADICSECGKELSPLEDIMGGFGLSSGAMKLGPKLCRGCSGKEMGRKNV